MSDQELLRFAAKAAGIDWADGHESTGLRDQNGKVWNPLTDDGDALRLAVKLKMGVNFDGEKVGANCGRGAVEVFGNDPYAATRRAIVRAAAAISEAQTFATRFVAEIGRQA